MSEIVYGAFVDYYGDIGMKQIKNENGWAVYATRVSSGLNQQRYIFAIVPARLSPGPETTLNQLDWVSLQARTTEDHHNVPSFSFFLDEQKKSALGDVIKCVDRTREETFYVTDNLPIKIRLLHDPKKNNFLQYPDQTTLYGALNTFRCVIEML